MKKILLILAISFNFIVYSQETIKEIRINDDFSVIKLKDNLFIHVTKSEIPPFGRIASNGCIFVNKGKAALFDTPCNDSLTKIVVEWIRKELKAEVVAFVPNHWHSDCLGGLNYIHSQGIKSYSSEITREICKLKGLPIPKQGFKDSLSIDIAGKLVKCYYLGGGHAKDNIVVWVPSERLLFPGCMVKEMNATTKGNTSDADLENWGNTLFKILNNFGNAKYVVPGHGSFGGIELIKHSLGIVNSEK